MKLRDKILARANEINEIAARYGASNLRLFGSVARGEERPDSDIDILATVDAENYSLWDVMDLEEIIGKIFGHTAHIMSDRSVDDFFYKFIADDLTGIAP
jgi:predicted nucleotidyltransferase